MTTVAISLERVLESVYAFCALDYFTSKEARPNILGRGQEPALRKMARRAAAELVYRLLPFAVGTNLDKDDGDIISIDLDIPDGAPLPGMRQLLEDALAASVMAVAWAGSSSALSDSYRRAYDSALDSLVASLRSLDKPGRIEAA